MKIKFDKYMWCYYCGAYRNFYKTKTGAWICKSCGNAR